MILNHLQKRSPLRVALAHYLLYSRKPANLVIARLQNEFLQATHSYPKLRLVMDATTILEQVRNHKGQTLRATWESVVPTLKAYAGQVEVTKRTECHVIAGVEFANRKEVREAIEAGTRGEVQPLPWGEWLVYPFIITHKGEEYVRLYPPTEAQMAYFNLKHETTWYADGHVITQAQAMEYCGSKAAPRDDKAQCFAVKCCNVVNLG